MEISKQQKVLVIGLGYVGLPLALLADRGGYETVGLDKDSDKVASIKARKSPFDDAAIAEELTHSTLVATTDFSQIASADIVIVCVPTPVDEKHMPDFGPIKNASESIAKYLKKGQLIVLESTVNPGVTENIVIPILEESGFKAGIDFYISHCPERINPGDPKWNVENIPRIVGSLEALGLQKTVDFYSSLIKAEIMPMASLKEAESVKIIENSFRDINIAFVNEIAMSFSRLDIDVTNVIRGAATKPFAFMPHFPGVGVGGHCIPVDPYYLIEYAKINGFEHDFLKLARRINSQMPKFTVDQLVLALNSVGRSVKGARVALLGLAYKANIDDCRESPSFEVLKYLKELGADVRVFDPHVKKKSTVESLEEALIGADAVIIATAHRELVTITPETFADYGIKVVIDGRNCLPKKDFVDAGIVYKGIGR